MILAEVLASLYAELMCCRLKNSRAEGFSEATARAGAGSGWRLQERGQSPGLVTVAA